MRIEISKDNYQEGRGVYKPEAIVIHIMQGTLNGTDQWFGGDNIKNGIYSSSHVGVGKSGLIHEYVKPEDTAYHAGRIAQPTWTGIKKNFLISVNPNLYTLGIECEGFRGETWTEEQMKSICDKVQEWSSVFNIPITRATIVSHSEIAIDKEDMSLWCDEIVKRLKTPTLQPNQKDELISTLEKALQIAKSL